MRIRRLIRRLAGVTIAITMLNFLVVVQRTQVVCTGNEGTDDDVIEHEARVPGSPYTYPEEVDLRIIVITMNRASSLATLLWSLDRLALDGATASLEIWIDRDAVSGSVDCETLAVARQFRWTLGARRVHVHSRHVGIYGQWLDTWAAPAGGATSAESELALILEDDLTVSPYAYRWLRAAHRRYGRRPDVAGYTLQSEDVYLTTGVGSSHRLRAPATQTAFLFKRIGTWGFAPHPTAWTRFQSWYAAVRRDPSFRPYVNKAGIINDWYKELERQGRQASMWSMWHVYHSEKNDLFTLYNNLAASKTATDEVALVENRKESGLHFSGSWLRWLKRSKLLTSWSEDYVDFPDSPLKYDWNGTVL